MNYHYLIIAHQRRRHIKFWLGDGQNADDRRFYLYLSIVHYDQFIYPMSTSRRHSLVAQFTQTNNCYAAVDRAQLPMPRLFAAHSIIRDDMTTQPMTDGHLTAEEL